MLLACAALLLAAVLLPAVFLRPTSFLEAGKDKLAESAPPSRGQLFAILEQRALRELGPEAALSSSLQKPFAFPTHARDDAIFGIDISHWTTDNCDCRIDWNRVASQKVAFVYIKATEGVSYKDKSFDDHWRTLSQHPRLHRGAYHFLRGDVDIEKQARIFLSKMGKLQPGDLPPAMDLEWDIFKDSTRKRPPADGNDYWSNLEADEIIEKALTWLRLVEKETGRIPIIYTSHAWWSDRKISEKKFDLFKRYPLWISAMEDKDLQLETPGAKGKWAGKWEWKLWQFTNKGDLTKAGIPNPSNPKSERMDVNIFPGTLEQFRQEMGIANTTQIAALDSLKVSSAQQTDRASDGGAKQNDAIAVNRTNVANNSGAESRSAPETIPATPSTAARANITAATNPTITNPVTMAITTDGVTRPGAESSGAGDTANSPATTNATATTSVANAVTRPTTQSSGAGSETSAADTPATASSAATVTNSPGTESTAASSDSSVAGTSATESSAATTSAADAASSPRAESSGANSEPSAANAPATESGAGTASGADTGNIPAAKSGSRPRRSARVENGTSPLSALFRRSMVEIVLVNGRVVRVDPNIDPAVLARLIAVLDGP